jgi:hypothetical protein
MVRSQWSEFHEIYMPVRLKISVVSTPLKWLRLTVYWIARFRHDLQPEERL